MKKYVLIFFLLHLLLFSLEGQQNYQPKYFSSPYQNLENPTILNNASYPIFFDDFTVESDFKIFYFDKNLYSILVTTRGRIHFSSTDGIMKISPVHLRIKSDSQIAYEKVGDDNCGNRILKIEYKNMGFLCDTTDTYFTNIQLWIYENSGIIEIHFGASLDNPEIYSDSENYCYGQNYYFSQLRLDDYWSAMFYGSSTAPDFYQGNLVNFHKNKIESLPPDGMVFQFDAEWVTDNSFKMSPNPARHFIKIYRPMNCGDFNIRIFDTRGQEVFSEDFASSEKKINVNTLLPGIYFIYIFDKKDHKSFVKKLMIL